MLLQVNLLFLLLFHKKEEMAENDHQYIFLQYRYNHLPLKNNSIFYLKKIVTCFTIVSSITNHFLIKLLKKHAL